MITGWILTVMADLVSTISSGIASLLPVAHETDALATSMNAIADGLASLNAFIPLTTLSAVLGLFFAVEGAMFAFKAGYFGIKKIPTIS